MYMTYNGMVATSSIRHAPQKTITNSDLGMSRFKIWSRWTLCIQLGLVSKITTRREDMGTFWILRAWMLKLRENMDSGVRFAHLGLWSYLREPQTAWNGGKSMSNETNYKTANVFGNVIMSEWKRKDWICGRTYKLLLGANPVFTSISS